MAINKVELSRLSLGICVSQVGEHISLGICVSQVGEHISLGMCVFEVLLHISYYNWDKENHSLY